MMCPPSKNWARLSKQIQLFIKLSIFPSSFDYGITGPILCLPGAGTPCVMVAKAALQ